MTSFSGNQQTYEYHTVDNFEVDNFGVRLGWFFFFFTYFITQSILFLICIRKPEFWMLVIFIC
jgi:hypothetical protein